MNYFWREGIEPALLYGAIIGFIVTMVVLAIAIQPYIILAPNIVRQ